jgi:hypothetical protein
MRPLPEDAGILRFDRNDYSLDPRLAGRGLECPSPRPRQAPWRSTRASSPAATAATSPVASRSPAQPNKQRSISSAASDVDRQTSSCAAAPATTP